LDDETVVHLVQAKVGAVEVQSLVVVLQALLLSVSSMKKVEVAEILLYQGLELCPEVVVAVLLA
jgi:hypothetical protein